MKKVLFLSNSLKEEYVATLQNLLILFQTKGFYVFVNEFIYISVCKNNTLLQNTETIGEPEIKSNKIDILISIGGDGTMLRSAHLIGGSNIPLLGINFGRLGFLADTSIAELLSLPDLLLTDEYEIQERTLIQIQGVNEIPIDERFALNEISIQKHNSSHLLGILTKINNSEIGTVWADGIIVATPTGSTAYSLSLGGPIVLPDTRTLIINPIAPHSLTFRPMIISDSSTIELCITSSQEIFNITLDSRTITTTNKRTIILKKADFTVKFIKFKNYNYFFTLKSKLMWGADPRSR
ncbi:MAG: NAD(+)/NADH kinase [Bacteroidales bacterium]